jgi:high-affinity iron transporter
MAALAAAAALLVAQVQAGYRAADATHDAAAAARLRAYATAAHRLRPSSEPLARLAATLRTTRVRLRPWPLVAQVDALAAEARASLPAPLRLAAGDEYGPLLDQLEARRPVVAEAIYAAGPGRRVQAVDPALAERTLRDFDRGDAAAARSDVRLTRQTLGEVRTSRATIVSDAAVIVFREGLEAVLILAALTASFVGARRALRRPVLLGAFAGFVATALTWVVAQTIVDTFSNGGLELQAITGLLAIGVLLLVTNWFFHRVYWSEWIGRFNKRRRLLEAAGGGTLGFVVLGLTSVYREGFETVLFLQSLQVSAGTNATLLGVAIGLAGTAVVGTATFLLQQKLPYKRMLIATGVLIAFVLAVMVGTTAHTAQGLGWLPIHPTPFRTPLWTTTWLGLYPTWETIALQLGSLAAVLGSYGAARALQTGRRRRALRGLYRAQSEPR